MFGFGRRLHGMDWSARLSAIERQLLGLACAAAVALAARRAPAITGEAVVLLAWCAYAAVELAVAWRLAARLDAAGTRRRAQSLDPGAPALFVLVATAACASVVAVVSAVDSSRALQGWARWGQLALAMASLAGSWLLIQVAFALHYARDFYGRGAAARGSASDAPRAGLLFPGGADPDYLDFFYVAAVVGMTSQVSDVAVSDRGLRRLTLAHALLAFAFNLVVLALAVNVLAGSLGG